MYVFVTRITGILPAMHRWMTWIWCHGKNGLKLHFEFSRKSPSKKQLLQSTKHTTCGGWQFWASVKKNTWTSPKQHLPHRQQKVRTSIDEEAEADAGLDAGEIDESASNSDSLFQFVLSCSSSDEDEEEDASELWEPSLGDAVVHSRVIQLLEMQCCSKRCMSRKESKIEKMVYSLSEMNKEAQRTSMPSVLVRAL